jgi:GxxExxY protein
MNADGRMSMSNNELNEVTGKIIGAAYQVGNTLGSGFLEKVYENALIHELRKIGLFVEQQKPIQIHYDGIVVGDDFCDVLVEKCVLVELKAVAAFDDIHTAQCLNYLKGTGLKICLLINFGCLKVDVKRIVKDF